MFSLDDETKEFYFTIPNEVKFAELYVAMRRLNIGPSASWIFNGDTKKWRIRRKFNVWVLDYLGIPYPTPENLVDIEDIINYGLGPKLSEDKIELFDNTYYKDDVKELLKVLTPLNQTKG